MPRNMNVSGPTLTSPVWAGDFLNREHLIPGGAKLNAAAFNGPDAVVVTTSAAAIAGAVALAVVALTGPLPADTMLYFGGTKYARVTVAAAAGATALTVAALPTAIAAGDSATYAGTDAKAIPSGTIIGRTIAERDALTGFGPAADTDDEIFIVAFDITDADSVADVELYRHGSIVKENFVPGWAGVAAGLKTKVRTLYACTIGA